jgi:pseudouridine kinase
MFDVVVIGAANMDVKAKLSAPHQMATSNPGEVIFSGGGVGRNIAHNLGCLGINVSLVTVFGNDAAGAALRAETEAAGVDLRYALSAVLPSSTYIATLDQSGELITAVNDMRIIDTLTPEAMSIPQSTLREANFIVADCNLPLDTLLSLARDHGDRLIIEPVSLPKSEKLLRVLEKYPVALVTPNRDQLHHLTRTNDIANACLKLQTLGVEEIVIHRGAFGATHCAADGKLTDLRQKAGLKVVDVTGAGDAAVAGLVFGLLHDHSTVDSVAFGQRAAAALVGISGSVLTSNLAKTLRIALTGSNTP